MARSLSGDRVSQPFQGCDPTHGGSAGADLDSGRMEWMLQVVDEIDDAFGALRQASVGLAAEIGLIVAGGLGIGAIVAAIATGAELSLICVASIILSLGAALKLHGWQLQSSR